MSTVKTRTAADNDVPVEVAAAVAPRCPRRRVVGVVSLVVAAVLFGLVTVGCESTPQDRELTRNLVNLSRHVESGLPALRENVMLDIKADAWAQKLRNQCSIEHSRLADGAPPEWRRLGENVGMGGSIGDVHNAYLKSPGHRRNIMDPGYTQIGTAAVWGVCDGYRMVFTVQVFMQ